MVAPRRDSLARIAYFLGSFPVISETFIGNEIRALEAMGHEIFPIALSNPGSASQPEDASVMQRTLYFSAIDEDAAHTLIKQYRFRLYRLLPFLLAQTTEPSRPFIVHSAYNANYIKEKQCTHIHAHFGWGATTYAIGAAKLLGLPVTFTCHGSDVYARPIDLALKCSTADAVFGVAPTITADLQKLVRKTPCHTVYCGVDTQRFKPLTPDGQKHGCWLFTGRLIDCKGIEDILAGWARLPAEHRPQLDIVGDGVLKEKLFAFVSTHGLNSHVAFLGAKSSAWIAEHGPSYRAFISAFRQGIDGSRDTAPMTLKEAMAMGLPIVTTDFIDIAEVTGRECALLCPVSSPPALAAAIMRTEQMQDSERATMGSVGRTRAEKYYSLSEQAHKISELFDLYKK